MKLAAATATAADAQRQRLQPVVVAHEARRPAQLRLAAVSSSEQSVTTVARAILELSKAAEAAEAAAAALDGAGTSGRPNERVAVAFSTFMSHHNNSYTPL